MTDTPPVPVPGGVAPGPPFGGVVGAGDAVQMFVATVGQLTTITLGSAAAPDTTPNPAVKINRTISLQTSQITGDGAEQAAGLTAVVTDAAGNQVQPVGLTGEAKSATSDALGVKAVGQSGVTGHVGIGATLSGRAAVAGAKASGVQVAVFNGTGSAISVTPGGFSSAQGVWITAAGGQCAAGVEIGNPNNQQFDVGFHITSQGTGGPIVSAGYRDDSSAAVSILINGTHATASISVAAGAGNIVLADAINVALGTVTGTQIGTAAAQKLGMFGAAPVVQPTSTGNTHTVAAGSTTNVFTNTTFDGGTGATAYTVGDIVLALKHLGLLAT